MTARIGVSPIIWSNDDLPALGGDTPLETCLAEAREAGFEGVELGRKFPREAAPLRDVLERHGLALVSGWYGARLLERSVEEEIEAARDHVELLLALGCTVMVVAETSGSVHGSRDVPLSRRPLLEGEEWGRFAASLTALAEHLAGRGLRMAYHHHMGTVVQDEPEIDRLMSLSGEAVGLLLDTGHLTFAGGDPAAVARRYGARIAHVHLKDVRSNVLDEVREHDASFLDAVVAGVFTAPGDGGVDYRALFAALDDHRYDGWLVVEAEQDPARAHPRTYARMGQLYVEALAGAAGLTGRPAAS